VVKLYRHNSYIRLGGDIVSIVAILAVVSFGVAGGALWWANREWRSQISLRALGSNGVFAVVLLQNSAFVVWAWWRMAHDQRARLGLTIGFVRHSSGFIALSAYHSCSQVISWSGSCLCCSGSGKIKLLDIALVAGDYVGQLVFLIAATIIAPLGEELLFRGYFRERLRQLSGVSGAIIGSALIFAVGHSLSASQGAIVLVMQTFVMGLVLAWLRHISGSIWAGLVAHSVNNLIAVTVATYVVDHPQTNGIDNSIAVAIVAYLLACVRTS
jgi:membrane protease YdiL (CAAX protease family)